MGAGTSEDPQHTIDTQSMPKADMLRPASPRLYAASSPNGQSAPGLLLTGGENPGAVLVIWMALPLSIVSPSLCCMAWMVNRTQCLQS